MHKKKEYRERQHVDGDALPSAHNWQKVPDPEINRGKSPKRHLDADKPPRWLAVGTACYKAEIHAWLGARAL